MGVDEREEGEAMRPIQIPEQSEEQRKRVGGIVPDDTQCATAHPRPNAATGRGTADVRSRDRSDCA